MKTTVLLLVAGLTAAAAFAQDLTLAELARRPEFLPDQATVKQAVRLQGLPPITAGQKLPVVSVRGTEVELETPNGRSTFTLPADQTDVLSAAQEAYRKLTPDQRALTFATLLQRKELWPYRVKLTKSQQLSTGTLKPGEAFMLLSVEGNDLLLVHEKGRFTFNVDPRDTDLLTSARQLLTDKTAFPARVVQDLEGKLVDPLTNAAATLGSSSGAQYFVFYRGAGWCGPCRQFSPALVKFYRETKPKNPAFEVVFISGDKTPNEMRAYAKEAGFSWVAVPPQRQPEMQIVNRLFTNLIPQLVVTDRAGNVVIDSARTNGPDNALKQFAALLKRNTPGAGDQ